MVREVKVVQPSSANIYIIHYTHNLLILHFSLSLSLRTRTLPHLLNSSQNSGVYDIFYNQPGYLYLSKNQAMETVSLSWIALILFQVFVIGGVAALTLKQFISFRRTVWYASFFSWLGWALCFSIVLMIPVDILSVCSPLFLSTPYSSLLLPSSHSVHPWEGVVHLLMTGCS